MADQLSWLERVPYKHEVAGSIPAFVTSANLHGHPFSERAQKGEAPAQRRKQTKPFINKLVEAAARPKNESLNCPRCRVRKQAGSQKRAASKVWCADARSLWVRPVQRAPQISTTANTGRQNGMPLRLPAPSAHGRKKSDIQRIQLPRIKLSARPHNQR